MKHWNRKPSEMLFKNLKQQNLNLNMLKPFYIPSTPFQTSKKKGPCETEKDTS